MPTCVDATDEDVLLMSLKGLVSQDSQEDVVIQGSGLSRGDKRRNERLARLRELVPVDNAMLAFDLADMKKLNAISEQVRAGRRCAEPL
jgi:transposase